MPLNPNQKIEIAHDILAREVYARIDASDKMRLKVTRFLRDRYDYYLEAGALLDKKDLDYISPYLNKVQPGPEQLNFIEKSRQEVEAKAWRTRRRNLAIAALLALAAVMSTSFWIRAQRQAWAAEEAQMAAVQAQQAAQDSAKVAMDQREKAEQAQRAAQEKEAEAVANANIARIEKDRATRFLRKLNLTQRQAVDIILIEQARVLIVKLKYEEAYVKLQSGAEIMDQYPSLGKALMELAFYYNESGDTDRAKALMRSTARQLGKPPPAFLKKQSSRYDSLQWFRSVLRSMGPIRYDSVFHRYYPEMVEVKGGPFYRGDENSKLASVSDFRIAKYETTWWQYALFCKATGKAYQSPGWGTDGHDPVVNVSWYDAIEYSNWLSRQLGLEEAMNQQDGSAYTLNRKANGFRLPTEAEWEYAARGGENQAPFRYAGSDDLGEAAWYDENSGERTHPVGKKKANALLIYDMSGNVGEWCWDLYDSYPNNAPHDFAGPPSGDSRVLRGGSWSSNPDRAGCASRFAFPPEVLGYNVGFRLARKG